MDTPVWTRHFGRVEIKARPIDTSIYSGVRGVVMSWHLKPQDDSRKQRNGRKRTRQHDALLISEAIGYYGVRAGFRFDE